MPTGPDDSPNVRRSPHARSPFSDNITSAREPAVRQGISPEGRAASTTSPSDRSRLVA